MNKQCAGECGEEKHVTEFGKNRSTKDGLNKLCKVCYNNYMKKYLKGNKGHSDRVKLQKKKSDPFSMQKDFLLEKRGNGCSGCGSMDGFLRVVVEDEIISSHVEYRIIDPFVGVTLLCVKCLDSLGIRRAPGGRKVRNQKPLKAKSQNIRKEVRNIISEKPCISCGKSGDVKYAVDKGLNIIRKDTLDVDGAKLCFGICGGCKRLDTRERKSRSKHEAYSRRRNHAISMLGGECVVCGTYEGLEFDHINPKDKRMPISAKFSSDFTKDVIDEIYKCQLLCKEHHLEKTKMDRVENPQLFENKRKFCKRGHRLETNSKITYNGERECVPCRQIRRGTKTMVNIND